MGDETNIAKGIVKTSIGYMMFSATIGVALGLVMLFYPGGTMALMEAAFTFFQVIISIFILYYTISEALYYFKSASPVRGVFYVAVGLLATLFVWLFNINLIYYIIAFFLILTGIGDIAGGLRLPRGKYFLIFLGIVNILIAIIILRNPLVLPLLLAWYVLFWGVSRLFLSFELRKVFK
jgi:uncharacterized membrane protein HdeD (DUF308 family)